jgi:RNA polymerase sigma-70 factor (ECF subfamily)
MDARTDEQLVLAVQEGDVFAFEVLVGRYQKKLHSFVSRMVSDSQMAQDIVQEAYINLYKTIDRIDAKRSFSIYVFSIARNTAISYLRQKKKHISLDMIELAEEERLYEQLVTRETQQTVRRAVAKLEPKYRRVIRLYYFDDVSYEQIAKSLQLPVNTVRTYLFRAKKILRDLLG